MSAVEDGLLGGLIVALVPGIRIKLGKPTLNKRQKRPLFGFLFSWSATILGFVTWPIIWLFAVTTYAPFKSGFFPWGFPL